MEQLFRVGICTGRSRMSLRKNPAVATYVFIYYTLSMSGSLLHFSTSMYLFYFVFFSSGCFSGNNNIQVCWLNMALHVTFLVHLPGPNFTSSRICEWLGFAPLTSNWKYLPLILKIINFHCKKEIYLMQIIIRNVCWNSHDVPPFGENYS